MLGTLHSVPQTPLGSMTAKVMAHGAHTSPVITDSLFVLPLLATVSSGTLALGYAVPKIYHHGRKFMSRRQPIFLDNEDTPTDGQSVDLSEDSLDDLPKRSSISSVRTLLDVLRTVCVGVLLGLSIYATAQADDTHYHGELGVSCFYLYNLVLCAAALVSKRSVRIQLLTHVTLLLLLAFCLFAYRDIWPELTYYLEPVDTPNAITWARIAVLSVAAVVIPLLRPRTYVPIDPLNPQREDELNPEQTSSPFFYLFYEYMTPLVWRSWKASPSLPLDDLHEVADYDRAEHLYKTHISVLDPVRRQQEGKKPLHLAFALIWCFRWEFTIMVIMCIVAAALQLIPTVAINQLLQYLAAKGEGAKLKPIVWVLLFFIGPMLATLAYQYFVFLSTRLQVRNEAILTQLLFDHALRLRLKESADGEKEKSKGIVGRINVLFAQDVDGVSNGRHVHLLLIFTPVQMILAMYLLFRLLGWSALFGVATMILTLPVPGQLTRLSTSVQAKKMVATDARVSAVTEAVGAIRILKMFGWEDRIKQRIADERKNELQYTWKRRLLSLFIDQVNAFLPVLTMTVSLAAYTLLAKQPLTAAIVFSAMTVFDILKTALHQAFYVSGSMVTCYVSLKRINDFLRESDMLDSPESFSSPEYLAAVERGLIRLKDATFAWGEDSSNEHIHNFRLHVPDVTFVKGKVNLITGPTGSGKTTLLASLIGELHFEGPPGSFYHLPREGGVSYAAQESWCLSASIKENIIFGAPYDAARCRRVLHDCGLEPDLALFDDGDETEIGERGVTLSGGQKARVTLARAIYANTSVVLLDDIFSALDTLTSRFILDHLFRGELVKDRTVVLVTHHVALATPVAAYAVELNDGKVVSAAEIVSRAVSSTSLVELQEEEEVKEEEKVAKKLVKDEEKSEGHVSKSVLLRFFGNYGGPAFWMTYVTLLLSAQAMQAFQNYWLGLWSKAYDAAADPNDVPPAYWLGLYIAWIAIGVVCAGAAAALFYAGSMNASRIIHAKLVESIFGAYMRFLDTTPVGRIIGRFTKDMGTIDGPFTDISEGVGDASFSLIIKFVSIIIFVPLFGIPAVIIGVLGAFIGELYIRGQLSVKREMSNAKSPLFSHFAAAISGIVSVRAYGAQELFRQQARRKADRYTRAAVNSYSFNRWVTIRMDLLGGVFSALLAAFLVYGSNLDAATAGFTLSQGVSFSSMMFMWVRLMNMFEVSGNSVERVEDYLCIDQEPKNKPAPAAWPTSGSIELRHLSAKYSADGPTVLDDLNVSIRSGERIGIVGRSGSGKSTLALALLRLVPTTGEIVIDGVDTGTISLQDLRTHITMIPQDPVLLSGTLRFNLDPFDDHDDATLNDALDTSGLRRSEEGSRFTLDTQITAGGTNLSQGQRQLVALARALVRQSKILILDEATASVDYATDEVIRESIQNLPRSTTVLTVAHRLTTIMDYDRILVMGDGRVLEFDTPAKLKAQPESHFAKLVQAMEG